MSQSRNLSRSIKEIENIYESVLNEKFDHQAVHHDKDDKVGFIDNTGPESAENVNLKEVDTEDLSEKEKKENHYEPTKYSQNSGKVAKESINNSVMSEDNIFDKLYKTVMEGEEVEEAGYGMSYEDDEDLLDNDTDGGDESVTVKLSPAHVAALLDLLGQVEEQVEDEDEGDEPDLGGDDEGDMDDMLSEAPTHLETAPDGVSKLTNKNNKVGNHKPAGKASAHGTVEADGDPKELGAKDHTNSDKSNVVTSSQKFG